MSTIVLFHSALGLRPAILRFADAVREDGHTVITPDLFDGEVFDSLEEGVAKRDALGIPALSQRAAEAVADLPNELVYMGFSMGAASAQWLAGTRPGAAGAVLINAALPLAMMGIPTWPSMPVAIHYAREDAWVDAAIVSELAAATSAEVHIYDGGAHHFTDSDHPEYDAEQASLLLSRVRGFFR